MKYTSIVVLFDGYCCYFFIVVGAEVELVARTAARRPLLVNGELANGGDVHLVGEDVLLGGEEAAGVRLGQLELPQLHIHRVVVAHDEPQTACGVQRQVLQRNGRLEWQQAVLLLLLLLLPLCLRLWLAEQLRYGYLRHVYAIVVNSRLSRVSERD